MDEKQTRKYLRRKFNPVGWSLVIYSLIMNVVVSVTIVIDGVMQQLRHFAEGNFNTLIDPTVLNNNAWGYLITIAVGLVILLGWKGRDFWREDIFARGNRMTAKVFFGVLSLCVGTQMVNSIFVTVMELILNTFGLSLMGVMESATGASDSISMFLYASIFAPIAEEILFRGYVLRTLEPYGRKFAIFGSAILFGLFHGNLVQTPYAFLMGLIFGYVAMEYSIGWAVALHMFNNLVVADLLSRATAGLPEMTASMIQFAIVAAFAIASVLILALNWRKIRDYLNRERMDRRCLSCFFTNSGVITLTVIMCINIILMLSRVS